MNKITTAIILAIISVYPTTVYADQTELGQASDFGELVSLAWAYGSKVIIVLAVFFIVLGALFYITSAGNEEKIAQGKEMTIGAIIAITIIMLSGVLMRILHKPAEGTSGTLSEVPDVINNATNILIGLMGSFTVLMIIYASFMYITGKADPDKIQKAHNALRYAIYGLIIGILSYTVVNAIIKFLI